jgi:hypothetical protein
VSDTVSAQVKGYLPKFAVGAVSAPEIAIALIIALYIIAAIFNLYVPNTGVDHKPAHTNPIFLVTDFVRCLRLLWADKLGQISLATTTLFWGAGATLQFIVLKWAEIALGYTLSQSTIMQGVTAIGIAVGALLAAKLVPAASGGQCLAGRHRDGNHYDKHDLRARCVCRDGRHAADRSIRWIFRGADECPAPASRPHSDGRGTFDCGAELQ